MAKQWVVGIDPGAKGAVAVYAPQTALPVKLFDIPHTQKKLTTGKNTHVLHAEKLLQIFVDIIDKATATEVTLYWHIEKVQAFGKQSAPAAFNFGYSAAIPYAFLVALQQAPRFVSPVSWKRQFNLQATDKDASRQLALRYFPMLASELKFKYNVDRADALFIAMYKFGA